MTTYKAYTTNHTFSQIISNHLALKTGFDAQIVPVHTLLPGTAMMYGILRGTGEIIKRCERLGRDYLYVDHSYFWQYKGMPSDQSDSIYFRIVKNSRYLAQPKEIKTDRLSKLKVVLQPWKKNGKKIVVVPMSRYVAALNGLDGEKWLDDIITKLSKLTKRPIVVKPKNYNNFEERSPFIDLIQDAHCVVVAESNVAVDAIVEGVPVFCQPECPAIEVSRPLSDLDYIEMPVYPDREQLLCTLSYNQFTVKEIQDGTARRIIEEYF